MPLAIDSTMLLLFLSSQALPPTDPATGEPISDAKERVDFLIQKAQKSRTRIIIPTPVLSEVLVRAGSARSEYLKILQENVNFKIMPFDARAAVDVADMTRSAIDSGGKRGGSDSTWAKVKFDRQIVAIAKNEQVSAIYSDDPDIRNVAARYNIPVIGLCEMESPLSTMQGVLPFVQSVIQSVPSVESSAEAASHDDDEPELVSDDTETETE